MKRPSLAKVLSIWIGFGLLDVAIGTANIWLGILLMPVLYGIAQSLAE